MVGGSLGQSIVGQYGALVLQSQGSYVYVSDQNAKLPSQGLAQDAFAYTESDGHGGIVQGSLVVTIVPSGVTYVAGKYGATIDSGANKSIVDASLGGQTVIASQGADKLVGGSNDTLTGGGGSDIFVFGPSSGRNVITDFNPSLDSIQFDRHLFSDVDDILAHTQQVGADTVITYHGTDAIVLQHVGVSNLQPSAFLLV